MFDPTLLWRVLSASPDADPVTGDVPAAPAGNPVSMDIEAFVASGGMPNAPVVELTGRRRAELDEGPAVSLAGRVVEADGCAPLAGARVVVTSTFHVRRHLYDHHLREVGRVETDAEGAWRIDRLDVDPIDFKDTGYANLHISVTAEGHAPALSVPMPTITRGVANRVVDVALTRATETFHGRVLDMWAGKPVVGARIYATGAIDPVVYPKDQRAALFVGAPTATTDEEGRFTIEGLGKGLQFVSAHGGDDCIGSEPFDIPSDREFVLRARAIRGRIEGTVVDGGGAPIDLVAIEGGENTTHSFADGRFTLENFRGDEVAITFSHPDFRSVVVETVKNGATGLIVRMDHPRVRIVLVATDGVTGAPIQRVRLEFAALVPEESGGVSPAGEPVRVSPDGRYPVRLPEVAGWLSVLTEDRQRAATIELAGHVDGEVVEVVLLPPPGE